MNEMKMLEQKIHYVGFVMFDLRLFLDTHPTDMTAITLFNKTMQKYTALVAEYERMYGPYHKNNDTSGNMWHWVCNPWPWENSANEEDN